MAQHNTVTVLKLNDGSLMPALGLGTFAPAGSVQKGDCAKAVKYAIEVGYRHFDGAFLYGNEDEVGEAIREKIADGTVKRENIFYTGKLWSTYHRPELVRKGLEESLKKLQFDYIDLFIIHWPIPLQPGVELLPKKQSGVLLYDNVDPLATWEALEACKDAGLVKSIGVSNFNAKQLGKILNKPGLKYKPVCNQVECHPYLKQEKLLEFCNSNDIVLVAYSPLGSSRDTQWIEQSAPVVLKDPQLISLAEKHGRTVAQIALRYLLQRGVAVIPKSFNPGRSAENFQVFDFMLAEEDMKLIDSIPTKVRYVNIFADHPDYPFLDEY